MNILKAPASLILITINMLVFSLMIVFAHQTLFKFTDTTLIEWGASFGPLTVDQWWRILSSMFVQNGLVHLALNLMALSMAGPMLEQEIGARLTLLTYVVCGATGAAVSLLWNPTVISCGASGAVFGVAAAILGTAWTSGQFENGAVRKSGVLIAFASLLYCIMLGILTPGIDNANHIGGLVMGLALGSIVGLQKRKNKAVAIVLPAALLAVAFLVVSLQRLPVEKREALEVAGLKEKAAVLMTDKKYGEAIEALDSAIHLVPDDTGCLIARAEARTDLKDLKGTIADCNLVLDIDDKNKSALLMRATAEHLLHDQASALSDLSKLIAQEPHQSLAYNNRAWSYAAAGQYDQALQDANAALKINTKNLDTVYDTRGVILACTGNVQAAIADLDKAVNINPKQGAAYYHRGLLYRRLGQERLAQSDMQKGRDLAYEPEWWEAPALSAR